MKRQAVATTADMGLSLMIRYLKEGVQAIVEKSIDVPAPGPYFNPLLTGSRTVSDLRTDTEATRGARSRENLQHALARLPARQGGWAMVRHATGTVGWRAEHWILGGLALVLTTIVGIVVPTWANAMRQESEPPAHAILALELPPLPAAGPEEHDSLPARVWQRVEVRAGQSLSDVFREQGFAPGDLQRALDSQADGTALRRIRPGQVFEFERDGDGGLAAMRFERSDATRVVLEFTPGAVREATEERVVERRVQFAHGVVSRSLFEAGEEAGLGATMVLKLAEAFAYDIDFALDLREGDRFSVIYDEVYREGERLRDGEVLAATFVNQGKRYSAIRHRNAKGETMLYTEDGRPLRKSFLRTPVEFTRISSLFSAGRKHPILGKMRAHKGVDYAAPSGTPIRAAGSGKVAFRGWKSGYGNFVMIEHDNRISTAYGHLSRFAPLKVGQRVSQGQTIGYVGMTGLATGPHLHYEFRVAGQHRNPLSVTFPPAAPLPATELAAFRLQAAPLLARLELLDKRQLARRSD